MFLNYTDVLFMSGIFYIRIAKENIKTISDLLFICRH